MILDRLAFFIFFIFLLKAYSDADTKKNEAFIIIMLCLFTFSEFRQMSIILLYYVFIYLLKGYSAMQMPRKMKPSLLFMSLPI